MFIFADPAATERAVGPKRFNPIPAFGTPNTVLTSFKSIQLYVKQEVHGWNSFYDKDPSLESPLQEAKLSYHLVSAFSCELRESPANMMDLNKVLHGKSWSGLDICHGFHANRCRSRLQVKCQGCDGMAQILKLASRMKMHVQLHYVASNKKQCRGHDDFVLSPSSAAPSRLPCQDRASSNQGTAPYL